MPRLNQERRDGLTDAAIAVLGRDGIHGLSHRVVDEEAGVPNGTTSNYFRSRDALLQAAAERLVSQHRAWIVEQRAKHPGPLSREEVIDVLSEVVEQSVVQFRGRVIAMFELAMESTRRPALREAFAQLSEGEAAFITRTHSSDGAAGYNVPALNAFYNGMLFMTVVIPNVLGGRSASEVTREVLTSLMPASEPAAR